MKKGLMIIALSGALITVFVSDSLLWHGVITAKYFWFSAAICAVSLSLPFQISKKNYIYATDLWFAVLFLYVCANWVCLNRHSTMQWWLTLLMIPLFIGARTIAGNEKLQRLFYDLLLIVVFTEAVWGLLQLFGIVRSYHNLYNITGSLFNPGPYAGFIAIGAPLALNYLLNKTLSNWRQWLGVFTISAIGLLLPVTMSRAAWIAAIAGCIFVLWKFLRVSVFKVFAQLTIRFSSIISRITAVFFAGILVVSLLTGVYLMKKNSADGRRFIWLVCLDAIKERPLFGSGFGRFAAVYGDIQAKYFYTGKGSNADTIIADSPDYAFNEYVQIAVELGIVGLVLFILTLGSTLSNRHFLQFTPRSSLVAFLIFSAFSYPFSVLPLSIFFIFLLAFSTQFSRKFSFILPIWLQILGIIFCWTISFYSAYQILPKRSAYQEWITLQKLYIVNEYSSASKGYSTLYCKLRHEKNFLFEYGQCLSKTGQYTESNRIFEEYLFLDSDPMVYNCMGNNFKEMGEYKKAENMYIRASQIVPNRHYPLYLLMKLYSENGQIEKAKLIANDLLKKPVKINSTAIHEMQKEAKDLLFKNEK